MAVVALLAAAFGGVGWAIVFYIGSQRAAAPEPCLGSEERLAGIWDDARKAALRTAFAAPGLAYGDDTWSRVSARIDAYATGWADMHRETCRATRVEGRQSDTLMDLRMACLDRHRAVLGALTDLWATEMNAQALENALNAAARLPLLADCADVRALTQRSVAPSDAARAPLVVATRQQLDRAQALFLAGRYRDSRFAAMGARVASDASGWQQLRADASYIEARALRAADDPAAEAYLVAASQLASAAGDDVLVARCLIDLVDIFAHGKQSADRALLIAGLADGALTRTSGHPELHIRLQSARGAALQLAGRYQDARAVLESALASATATLGPEHQDTLLALSRLATLAKHTESPARARSLGEENLRARRAVFGPGHPQVASALNTLGGILVQNGDNESAAVHYRECLAIWERVVGPDTTLVANALNNLGAAELQLGHLDEAEQLFLRALAIRERELGPDHLYVASTLGNLGLLRVRQGRHDEAIAYGGRSLAIETKVNGPTHASLAYSLGVLAEAFLGKGDVPKALEYDRRVFELRRTTLGPDHVLTLIASVDVARLLWRLGRCRDARPLLATAMAGLEKAEDSRLADALGAAAECELVDGKAARAVASAERALVISGTAPGLEGQRGLLSWTLARARWSLGHRSDAIAAARRAAHELGDDPSAPRERAAIAAWLGAHDRR
jgi:eukaryotic-like serine/threonine-protein kinase